MAKTTTNKVNIDEQDYLSEEQKKKAKEEEKKAAEKKAEEEKRAAEEAAAAQAKANKEADLIGAKDAEKLNSEPKTTSSTSAAEKAKNSSVTKNATATEAKQTISDSTAKRAGAEEGVQKVENAKVEKAAAQAKANKEADLIGYDGHAAQQAYAQQVQQEKTEYLNVKEARDKKYQLEQELAELKEQAKNQTKDAGTVQTVSAAINPRKGANTSVIDPELQKRIDELEKEINDLNKNINLASGIQNQKYLYKSAVDSNDFEEYSKEPVKQEETGPKVYKQANIERETETVKGYMTEEERAVYNYYYNKYGEEKAEEFFESIRGELNRRQAEAMFAGNEGKLLNEYIIGATAGLESSKEGYQGALRMLLGDDTIQPTGTYSYLSQMAREDLADTGIKLPEALGGASLGQIGFDVVNTTANMLPSIALGTLGGSAVGAAAIGTSAAGNAYNNALAEGYSKDQATNYAVLVGASEAGLGYVLGGIEATGGKISNAALGKVLPKIDNALAKAAVNVSGKMASEFTEEYLQEVLTPVFENIALKEENEIDLLSEEAIYAGILGALSAGGIALIDGSANIPEAAVKTEVPVPFNGTAQPGTEAALVADKITEIENRPISEAEKAAAMEKVVEAVAQNGTEQGLIEEAEKFRDIHKERQGNFVPAIKANINEINKIPPVITITENKFSQKNTGLKLTESVKNFFQSLGGKVNRTGFGEVLLSQSGVRKSISSGIGEEKAKAFEAVPEVIKYGLQVDFQENFKNRGYDTYTFAAPYITDEGKRVLGVIVKQDANSNRYYLHEVVDENGEIIYKTKETPDNAIKTGPDQNGQDTGALPEVSENIIHPVTGFDNTSTIGNNVFGAGILDKTNAAENIAADNGTRSLNMATLSMERADAKLNAEDWKGIAEAINPEIGIWRMKEFARVLDSAAGGNKVLRQQLFELYEKPLNEAQGNYARNYSEKAKQISDKFKELGIKTGSKESAAVQRIGEGVKEINKNGDTEPYTLYDLKRDFPDSWQNIKEGADFCRTVYDKFLNDLNTMYSEIYPATVEQANERISGYDTRISADNTKIENIKTVIENLETLRAEKQVELSKKRPETLIYGQIQNQIANIDQKIEKAEKIIERLNNRKLTKEIARDTLKSQVENGEILKNKQILPRKDYFRHFQELTNEFAEIADIFSNDQRIPPNLAGKSETTKPRTIWTSLAQQRGKNYYTEDAVGGLLRYTEIAEKLLAYDPLISHFRDVNSAIRAAGTMVENEVKGKGTNAGQFAAWADDITNQLAGKTNAIDRFISDRTGALGRATIKSIEALNRRVKSNAILGNFRSALVQVGNLPNATLYIQNPIDWTNGVISTFGSKINGESEIAEARGRSNFMNRRYMGDSIDELTKEIQNNNILNKPKEFALWMLGAGDRAAAELIWHTAYTRAVRNPDVMTDKGPRIYESAVDYADDITRRSIAGRAEGDMPYFEESKLTGLIAPFQIEVANTFNAFSEQFGKKNAAGIIAFEVSVFLLNTVLEGITGDRPLGLDFIDVALDIIKEATGEEDEEEKDIWELLKTAGGRIGGEILSSMPFGTQIGSILTGGDEQKAENWFGDSDPTRYGTGNIGMGALADAIDYLITGENPEKFFDLVTDGRKNSYKEWADPIVETVETFAPLLMPWGGKQFSRTVGGIDQIIQGGAYGTENDGSKYLKFPQEYDAESIIKTVLFGQYASDRGQDYIDSNFQNKLSAKQTEQMELAEKWGISKEDFYDVVLGLKEYDKKADKQEALFNNQDLTAGEKGILEHILFGESGKPYEGRDYSSEEGFYRSGRTKYENILLDAGYSEDEVNAIEKAVKNGGNKAEDIAAIREALGCTEAEAFEIYQRREGNWVDSIDGLSEEDRNRFKGAAEFYGISEERYLDVLNYSKYGVAVTNKDGEVEYSTKMDDVVPNIAKTLGLTNQKAEELYYMVNSFEYSREDLEEEDVKELQTAQNWYGVDDKGYFVARNVIKSVEGKKDGYGNTISGSEKEAQIKEIAKQLNVSEEEASIYYLAAKGDLVLSVDDLSTAHRKDLEEAKKYGWTERQYIDAVNLIKASGASKKDEIIKTLTDAGASYTMAQGYYNLREDKDYYRDVSTKTIAYGMSDQKQADKIDYYMEHYNSNSDLTAEDVAKWVKAAKGLTKKADIVAAYESAGATHAEALKLYALMKGYDKAFKAYYKENGGN